MYVVVTSQEAVANTDPNLRYRDSTLKSMTDANKTNDFHISEELRLMTSCSILSPNDSHKYHCLSPFMMNIGGTSQGCWHMDALYEPLVLML